MKLITKEIEKLANKYPLYSQDSKGDEAIVWAKFFDPCGRYTFFVTEMDLEKVTPEGPEGTIFGYCISSLGPDCDEYGYGDLKEMASVRNRLGIGIERDMHFEPCLMGDVKND